MKSMQSKKKHVSRWRKIIVKDKDESNIFELNESGSLLTSFSKQKYRNIKNCFENFITRSIECKKNEAEQLQSKNNFSFNFIFNYDEYENDSNLFDEFDFTNFFETFL